MSIVVVIEACLSRSFMITGSSPLSIGLSPLLHIFSRHVTKSIVVEINLEEEIKKNTELF